MSRADLEKQFELQYKDKTPEEMMEIGRQIALDSIKKEKEESKNRIEGLRALFNVFNPSKSHKLK